MTIFAQLVYLNIATVTTASIKIPYIKISTPESVRNVFIAGDSLCQKVFKIKYDTDIRKYIYPTRGSKLWMKLYK